MICGWNRHHRVAVVWCLLFVFHWHIRTKQTHISCAQKSASHVMPEFGAYVDEYAVHAPVTSQKSFGCAHDLLLFVFACCEWSAGPLIRINTRARIQFPWILRPVASGNRDAESGDEFHFWANAIAGAALTCTCCHGRIKAVCRFCVAPPLLPPGSRPDAPVIYWYAVGAWQRTAWVSQHSTIHAW